jgi:hypothetical protein
MVDYKKWDKFVADLSSDEEDHKKPIVTTIPSNSGGRVTIGPQGYTVHDHRQGGEGEVEYGDAEYWNEDEIAEGMGRYQLPTQPLTQRTHNKGHDRVDWIEESSISSSGYHQSQKSHASVTLNGGEGIYHGCRYCWSQDRYEVTLRLFLPVSSIQYTKRTFFLYFDEIEKKLSLFRCNNSKKELLFNHLKAINYDVNRIDELKTSVPDVALLFSGDLQYAIQLTGDANNPYDEVIEWELVKQEQTENQHSFRVDIVVKKLCPIPNATLWWERVFVGEPKIDVTKISGRNLAAQGKDTLQQAHELFLQRIKEQKKIDVDYESDNENQEKTDAYSQKII